MAHLVRSGTERTHLRSILRGAILALLVLSMACSISSPLCWLVAPTRVWGMAMDTAWHEVETQPAPGVSELHPSLEQ